MQTYVVSLVYFFFFFFNQCAEAFLAHCIILNGL